MDPKISLFLPVYNEEENLANLHLKINEALERLGLSYEVIYVDDGSTDGSLNLLRKFAEADPRIRGSRGLCLERSAPEGNRQDDKKADPRHFPQCRAGTNREEGRGVPERGRKGTGTIFKRQVRRATTTVMSS